MVDPASPRMRATVVAVRGSWGFPTAESSGTRGTTTRAATRGSSRPCGSVSPSARPATRLGYGALEYALARQTRLGLLPEQVTREGEPAWVVPLGWSHVMLVLAARPELAVVRDGLVPG